ncbi:MAG: carboxypeptidase regulatory-like domain-containing protein [Euryarchaeota archaeon]|nr:carboxypeptidase regulatory-like domain-containing protein [Euryarchaeota archaeon]
MPTLRRTVAGGAATAVIFVGVLLGSGCTSTAPYVIETWEEVLLVYAEAASPTSPFLSLNDQAGSATSYAPTTALTDGLDASRARMTGAAPTQSWTFPMTEPLAKNYYLNLSKYVGGVVWFTDSAATATSMDQVQLRAEVFSGAARVGGAEFTWTGGNQISPWIPFYFKFRPEKPVLGEGDQLSLKLTRINGGFDLKFGTSGKQQSLLEFHYFDFDPLGSVVYLEGRKQFFSATEDDGGGLLAAVEELRQSGALEGPEPATYILQPKAKAHPEALVALGLLGAPLLGLGPRRRGGPRGVLLAAVFLGGAFSGCLSEETTVRPAGEETTPHPSPTARVTYEKNETLAASKVGAIKGRVLDEYNISVRDAHVSLLGTTNFGKTDAAGRFQFPNVTAGVYLLRIDHSKFLPLEKDVEVKVGEITHVNVTLAKPVTVSSNKKEHVHDEWGDATTFTYPAFSHMPASTAAQTHGVGLWVQPYYTTIVSTIVFPDNTVILPGTGVVELVLKWTGGPRELGLRITTGTNSAADQNFVPRPSGQPFRVAIFPNEADPGHQKFTNWVFSVTYAGTSTYTPTGAPPVISGNAINVQLILHKSVVPLEPSHRDFWGAAQELPVADRATLSYSCLGCDLPDDSPSASYKWAPMKGGFIPVGTAEVRGTMTFKHTYSPVNLVEFNVWYKPANLPTANVEGRLQRATIESRQPDFVTFLIKPKPEEVDQFYQFASNWLFYPGDDNPDYDVYSAHGLAAYPTTFTLTANAIRDPTWNDV